MREAGDGGGRACEVVVAAVAVVVACVCVCAGAMASGRLRMGRSRCLGQRAGAAASPVPTTPVLPTPAPRTWMPSSRTVLTKQSIMPRYATACPWSAGGVGWSRVNGQRQRGSEQRNSWGRWRQLRACAPDAGAPQAPHEKKGRGVAPACRFLAPDHPDTCSRRRTTSKGYARVCRRRGWWVGGGEVWGQGGWGV